MRIRETKINIHTNLRHLGFQIAKLKRLRWVCTAHKTNDSCPLSYCKPFPAPGLNLRFLDKL